MLILSTWKFGFIIFSKSNSAHHYFSKSNSAHHYLGFSKCKQALIFKPALLSNFLLSQHLYIFSNCESARYLFILVQLLFQFLSVKRLSLDLLSEIYDGIMCINSNINFVQNF